jgi:hypothetical protein
VLRTREGLLTHKRKTRGLYHKTLRLCNVHQMGIFCNNLVLYNVDHKHTTFVTNALAYYGICTIQIRYIFIVQAQGWKSLPETKHSGLFQKFVIYGQKMFYYICPRKPIQANPDSDNLIRMIFSEQRLQSADIRNQCYNSFACCDTGFWMLLLTLASVTRLGEKFPLGYFRLLFIKPI